MLPAPDQRRAVRALGRNGLAYTWGYDGLCDEWQEQMLRHAAAISGVKWIEPQK